MPDPVNILLVDDKPQNLSVLESILDCPEYRLTKAQSAQEALVALFSTDFALIVLDVRMPDTSGLELARIIKERRRTRDIPIVFVTAHSSEDEHVLSGYSAGAVDYLTKPINPAILKSKVAVFAGSTGLEIYGRLVPQAHHALRTGGYLVMEIGYSIEQPIRDLLRDWSDVEIKPDLQGIPRVAIARKP